MVLTKHFGSSWSVEQQNIQHCFKSVLYRINWFCYLKTVYLQKSTSWSMKSYSISSHYLQRKYSIKSVSNAKQHSEHVRNESVWNFLTVSFPVATIFKSTLLLISKCSMHKQTCQEDEVEEWPHSKSKSWQAPCKRTQKFKRII